MTHGPPLPSIGGWQWDDGNLPKAAAHGFTPRFRANLRGRATTHQMIGPAADGRIWTLCVMHVYEDVWRCVTGWPSTPRETEWYGSAKRPGERESR